MNNEFSKKTKDLFDLGWYMMSFESGRNDWNVLHHILWRCSNSPYNACPLNNNREHMPEGRKGLPAINSFLVEKKYLLSTMSYLASIDYQPNDADKQFIKDHKEYYWDINLC